MKYNLTVTYVPGNEMHVADALSRAFLENTELDDLSLNQIVHSLSISDEKIESIKSETRNDPVLLSLIELNSNGWPRTKDKLKQNVKLYWKHQHEIYAEDGIVFLNERIIVPKNLKSQLMEKIHSSGHFGINRTIATIIILAKYGCRYN